MTVRNAYGSKRKRSRRNQVDDDDLEESRSVQKKKTSENTILYDTMNMFEDEDDEGEEEERRHARETDKLSKSANAASHAAQRARDLDDETTGDIVEPSTELSINDDERIIHSEEAQQQRSKRKSHKTRASQHDTHARPFHHQHTRTTSMTTGKREKTEDKKEKRKRKARKDPYHHDMQDDDAYMEESVIIVEDTILPKEQGETPVRSAMKHKKKNWNNHRSDYVRREKLRTPPSPSSTNPPPPSPNDANDAPPREHLKKLQFEKDMIQSQFNTLKTQSIDLQQKHNHALHELKQLQLDFGSSLVEKDKALYKLEEEKKRLHQQMDDMKKRLHHLQDAKANTELDVMRIKQHLIEEKEKRTIVTQKYFALKEAHRAVPSNLDEIIEVVKFNELVSGLFVNHVGIKRQEIPPEYIQIADTFSKGDLKACKMCFIYYKELALQCIILLARDADRHQGLFIPIAKAYHRRGEDGRSHFRSAKYIPNEWPEQMRNVVGFEDDRLHCLITKIKYKLYQYGSKKKR